MVTNDLPILFRHTITGNIRSTPYMKNRIKVYRALRNLTQEVLADQLGVTRQTILAIEKEKYDPSLELAFRISRLFRVPLEKMFLFETEGEDQPLFED
jgi:putative transcriptional regulator